MKVYLREGVYYLNETLVLDPRDGGGRTYAKYPSDSGEVVISAGFPIEGTWKQEGKLVRIQDKRALICG